MTQLSDYTLALSGHARHYAAFAQQHGPHLHGAGKRDRGKAQLAAMRLFQLELGNIEAALDGAAELRGTSLLEHLAAYLYRFLLIRGDASSVLKYYNHLLAVMQDLPGDHRLLELHIRCGHCAALVRLGEFEPARRSAEILGQLAEQLDDTIAQATTLRNFGLVENGLGHAAAALEQHTLSLELSRKFGDPYGEAASLSNMGLAHYGLGDYAQARVLLSESLQCWRSAGDVFGEAAALQNLGNVEALQEHHAEAVRMFVEALALSSSLGSRSGEMSAHLALGYAQQRCGEVEAAHGSLLQALSLARELGDRQTSTAALGNLATIEFERGEMLACGELLAEALEQARDLGNVALLPYLCIHASAVIASRGQASEATMILAAALQQLSALGYTLDAGDQRIVDVSRCQIATALDGAAPDAEWEAEGEQLSSDQLLRRVLAGLLSDRS